MAYDGTLYASVSGNGFTSSCLEGIPFKISPKFKPPVPSQKLLPSNIGTRTASSALHSEYSFEVEEAVLKWSAEREKQREEKLELQRQATLRKSLESSGSDNQDEQDADTVPAGPDCTQPLYENTKLLKPAVAPRPRPRQKQPTNSYANVTITNSLIANISNDILQPTLIQNKSKETEQNMVDDKNASSKNDLDLTLFEKQDDPFDNVELRTINDMEELASVLQNTTNITPGRDENGAGNQQINGNNIHAGNHTEEEEIEDQMYENVNLVAIKNGHVEGNVGKMASNSGLVDLSKLPTVPPRRDLVGGSTSPLPPIGQPADEMSNSFVLKTQTSQNSSGRGGSPTSPNSMNKDSVVYDNPSTSVSFPPTDSTKPISYNKPPVKKPPRTFKYSRHVEPDQETNVGDHESNGDNVHLQNNPSISTSFSEGNFSVQFTKTQSNPSISEKNSSEAGLCFDSNHFGDQVNSRPVPAPRKPLSPPIRPSSGQSWNRYSPLPPTPIPSNTEQQQQPATVALPVISPGTESYSRLRKEAKTSVDNLVGMGFTRDRVIRAVEKLGEDEKEIVEFLCLVDQLTEKGYSVQLAETALLRFRNSMKQASAFLELFTQFQELGFSGEKIKDALVNTNNDREKTLDILTASS